jgi:2-keto-4-pentenoate hydratase
MTARAPYAGSSLGIAYSYQEAASFSLADSLTVSASRGGISFAATSGYAAAIRATGPFIGWRYRPDCCNEVKMNTAHFEPAVTASILLKAWRSGELLQALPHDTKPDTLAQGYDAQDELFKAAGGSRAGWKLGVGSPAALRAGNLSRALIGQLGAGRLYRSGTALKMPAPTPVTIECEIAFVLARDLPPLLGRQIDPADIRSTCVTFEVVRSRFTDRKTVGWPSFAADNVGFEALIVGEAACSGLDEAVLQQLAETTVVHLDGQAKAKGLFGDTATDPLNSLRALYAHAGERGITLRAGDIITTGAMCEPFDIEGVGHQLSVSYFGKELSFSL